MTTTLERFYTMNGIGVGDTYFETNGDLGVYLSRGGEDTARYADGGIALVMLDVDDSHSVVSVDTRGSRPSIKVLNAAIAHMTTARDELRRLGGGR